MTSLYEVLKASRIPSSAPDMYTDLWAKNLTGGGYTPTEHQYTGEVPTVIIANGEPLISCLIYGNMAQSGTPSPTTPIQPQECGDLETTGEHAGQYKIPVLSANTTTPVYLGEVESTRQIKKLVFTGQEDWERNDTYSTLRLSISDGLGTEAVTCMCSHYVATNGTSSASTLSNKEICIRATGATIWIKDTDFSTATDFKTYLQQQYAAGTPVTVWYVLATPQTAVVNEPIRKIGEYADSVSASNVPTIAGSQTFDVETALKPSSVDITYIG